MVVDRTAWVRKRAKGKIIHIGCGDEPIFTETNVTRVDKEPKNLPNFHLADAKNLPFPDGSFDTAVLAETLEHIDDPEKAISEALRVARRVIITVPLEWDWDTTWRGFNIMHEPLSRQDHMHFFTEEEVRKILEKYRVVESEVISYAGLKFFCAVIEK